MPRFQKGPIVVEAEQFDSHTRPLPFATRDVVKFGFYIDTLEGPRLIQDGDWIIRGARGEFTVCKPSIFAELYTLVPESRAI
jgi:hypothetical protein